MKQFFEENNIPVDIKLKDGNTILHTFAREGLTRLARAILNMGADINIQNDAGNTPLHLAIIGARKSIVILLAERHARPEIKNKKEETVYKIMDYHEDRAHYREYLPKENDDTDLLRKDYLGLFNPVLDEDSLSDDEDNPNVSDGISNSKKKI